MASTNALVLELLDRTKVGVHAVVDGLNADQLSYRIESRSNSIAWLIWHLTRVQDEFVSRAAGAEQLWLSGSWFDRFGFPFDRSSTGLGHTSLEVAAVTVTSGDLLVRYYDECDDRSLRYVSGLTAQEYDRIIDASMTPVRTLKTHLVIMLNGMNQHLGQAAYLRGLLPDTD